MRRTVFTVVCVLAFVLVVPVLAAAEERYSGSIVAVDPGPGTIVIEELTASRGETPRAVRRTVTLAADARIELQEPTPDGYKGLTMSRADLRSGDFVTVVASADSPPTPSIATALDVVRESPTSASPRY